MFAKSMKQAVVAVAVGLTAVLARGEIELPEGYEALDGIASTEGGKQYICTDYVPSSCNVKIEATVTLTKWGTQGIWCSRKGATEGTLTLFCWAEGSYFRIDRNKNSNTYAGTKVSLKEKVTLVADYKKCTFTAGETESKNKMSAGDFTPAANLAFFASHSNGTGWGNYAVMTIHDVKVYDADGNLECEFVPVRCAANAGKATEYGLLEVVRSEKKYFSTPGTTAFDPVRPTSVVWSEDAEADALVLTVTGTYGLTADDCARITSTTHANFIKRGDGVLVGAPIQAFTGNITVEEGVFRLAHRYDCGADDVGWIRVCDGATLEVSGFAGVTDPRAITGKTVYTTGEGYKGMGVLSGGCSWNSCSNCRFILEGDSYYYANAEFNFVNYIDLAGHVLKGRQATTWLRWGISNNTITNSAATPATFDFVGGMLRPETLSSFRGKATDGLVKIRSDSASTTVVSTTYGISSVWPVELGPNVSYSAREITDPADVSHGVLSGPLTFKGAVKLATDISKSKNSIVNLKGTLTGTGTVDIGTGWVNYHVTENDYAGTVTVARSNELASADYRAGIGVMAGAAYSSAGTTFKNADLRFSVGKASTVSGPLCFTGDDQCRLTGGNCTGERTKLALVRKEGAGELLLEGAVAITGRLEVASGKVRFPSRAEYMPVVGKPGLMGSVTNEVCWKFSSPDMGDIPCVYDTVYPHGTDLTSRWDGTAVFGPRTTMVRGYVWNRTDADVTWTFKPNHNDRVWLWLDDKSVFSNAQRTEPAKTLALTPGPHKFVLITTSSYTSNGPQYVKWVSGKGSLYDSLPVDFTGSESPELKVCSPLWDPGDGSVFTIDDTKTEDLTDPFWLSTVDTMAFASSAELDLGGYDYSIPRLEGAPKVLNAGTLTVGTTWKLDPAAILSSKLEVAGNLAFGDGAMLELPLDPDFLALDVVERLDAGLTIATATGTIDAQGLALPPAFKAAGATLTTTDDGKSLVLTLPASRYMRATADGLELGFSVRGGRPYKEVRLDIYRDGRQIAQTFVGDAHKLADAWSFDGPGYYVVKVVHSARTSDAPDETETETVAYTFGQVMVSGGTSCIVSTEPAAGEYASIIDAVAALGAGGGKVYVRPGTYAETMTTSNGVWLTAAVQVIGLTDDPTTVVVTRQTSYKSRIFTLNHKDAAIRFLTVTGGELVAAMNGVAVEGNGGNVFVSSKGGTVENCILKDGSTEPAWSAGGGNIALFGGRMANCRLIGGKCNTTVGANQWIQCGSSVFAKSTDASDVVIENCLITGAGLTTDKDGGAPVGLYNNVRMVNCTVADSVGTRAGGVVLFKTAKDGTLPQVVNCAFYNNRTLATDAAEKPYKNVYASILNYRSSTGDNGITDEAAAAAFANCASKETINDTCVTTDAPRFADAANGDYRLTAESPLVNAGYDTSAVEGIGLFDLIGSPRFVRRVDIGCFEYREPKFERKGSLLLFW